MVWMSRVERCRFEGGWHDGATTADAANRGCRQCATAVLQLYLDQAPRLICDCSMQQANTSNTWSSARLQQFSEEDKGEHGVLVPQMLKTSSEKMQQAAPPMLILDLLPLSVVAHRRREAHGMARQKGKGHTWFLALLPLSYMWSNQTDLKCGLVSCSSFTHLT